MNIKNFKTLNKDTVLNATKDGFLFYKQNIPRLELKSNNISCKSVRNPFYIDNRPSLSIYYYDDRWYFKDFGDETYSGDVFDFAALKYGIDKTQDFELLLETMMDEVVNFDEETINSWVQPDIINKNNDLFKIMFDDRSSKEFTTKESEFWSQYGIDGDTLDSNRITAVDSYAIYQDDESLPIIKSRPVGKMWFAYKRSNYAKIYCPEPKSFWSVGQKPNNYYVFGTPFDSYPEQQEVILTGGEKDALTLIAHGFNAITLNSETAALPNKLLKDLYESKMHVCGVLYDLDETGVRRASDLALHLKCPVISLPNSLIEKGGKDVSDYFKLGGSVEELKSIIDTAQVSYQESAVIVPERKIVRTASQRLEDAKNQPEIYKILDVFLHSGELGILFGDTGIGKSLLAVAIADAVSRGVNLLSLENECDPTKVMYYDFELSDKQFQKRYTNSNGENHKFSDLFYTDNIDFSDLTVERGNRFEKVLMDKIRSDIQDIGAQFIIIDNITYLSSQTSADVQVAMEIMKQLKRLKEELQLTILVLAHTPKRPPSKPLTINELAGSKQLSNFADSVFAFGFSGADKGCRYLKQVKPSRSGELKFDEGNVLKCELLRDETDETFLTFNFLEFCEESSLLSTPQDDDELKDEAASLQASGLTLREIAAQIGVSKSKVGRWLQ